MSFRLSLIRLQTSIVFPSTTQPLPLLEVCLPLFPFLFSLQDFIGPLLLRLGTTLSPFDPFQFGVFTAESATLNVTCADTERSTHLVHLCLLGSSQSMRVGRLEVADVDVA